MVAPDTSHGRICLTLSELKSCHATLMDILYEKVSMETFVDCNFSNKQLNLDCAVSVKII